MALLHVLMQNTYSLIDNVMISREGSSVQFTLNVFSDSTKSELVMSRVFSVYPSNYVKVRSISATPSTSNPEIGDMVFIPMDHSGDFSSFAGKIITYDGSAWVRNDIQTFSITVDEKKFFKVRVDGILMKQVQGSQTLWEEYFDSSVSTASNTNIVKQCYKYLKDSEFYSGTEDV